MDSWHTVKAGSKGKKAKSKPKKKANSKARKSVKRGAAKNKKSRSRSMSPSHSHKWITKEGKLGGAGYLHKSAAQRHKLLNTCVKEYGYKSCLGSVMVLNRNAKIKSLYGDIIDSDKVYLMKKFGAKK